MTFFEHPAAPRWMPVPVGDGAPNGAAAEELVARLRGAEIFGQFKAAFELIAGVELRLAVPGNRELASRDGPHGNAFCALLAARPVTAERCRACQCAAREAAGRQTRTRRCFAGLCESVVPVRMGETVVAQFEIGQVRLAPPSPAQFDRLVRRLQRWDPDVEVGRIRAGYFRTRVIEPRKYRALLRMLEGFGGYLALVSNGLVVAAAASRQPVIERAKTFVDANIGARIGLGAVARAVERTPCYFCKLFRRETGLRFTDYLTRRRIEKAKQLLLDPHARIGEAAYAAGFQSLSQFNRAFKRVMGEQPTTWREHTGLH